MSEIKEKTILIVDDASENIAILAELLSEHNIKVATNGKRALEIINSGASLDLILLDVMMPEIDGFEVAQRVKSNPRSASIPIIFVTGKTDVQSFIRGFDLGAEEYIFKPFDSEAVLRIVNSKLYVE